MKILVSVLFLIASVAAIPQQKLLKSDDDSTFYIEPQAIYNWFDAWNECARRNMSLMAIDTFKKHQQIDTLMRKTFPTNPEFWIAGQDNAVDKRYEWATSGEVFSFTNWGANQPDRFNNLEHCILMWHDFAWHDLPCSHKLGYICEENKYFKQKTQESTKEQKENTSNKAKTVFVYVSQN